MDVAATFCIPSPIQLQDCFRSFQKGKWAGLFKQDFKFSTTFIPIKCTRLTNISVGVIPCQMTQKTDNSKPYPFRIMKFGVHVGFGPQTSNLKFFVDWFPRYRRLNF